jgi:hypothetical protein
VCKSKETRLPWKPPREVTGCDSFNIMRLSLSVHHLKGTCYIKRRWLDVPFTVSSSFFFYLSEIWCCTGMSDSKITQFVTRVSDWMSDSVLIAIMILYGRLKRYFFLFVPEKQLSSFFFPSALLLNKFWKKPVGCLRKLSWDMKS